MNDETNNLFLRYSLSLSLILYSPFTLWTDMYSLYLSDFCTSLRRYKDFFVVRRSFIPKLIKYFWGIPKMFYFLFDPCVIRRRTLG